MAALLHTSLRDPAGDVVDKHGILLPSGEICLTRVALTDGDKLWYLHSRCGLHGL